MSGRCGVGRRHELVAVVGSMDLWVLEGEVWLGVGGSHLWAPYGYDLEDDGL